MKQADESREGGSTNTFKKVTLILFLLVNNDNTWDGSKYQPFTTNYPMQLNPFLNGTGFTYTFNMLQYRASSRTKTLTSFIFTLPRCTCQSARQDTRDSIKSRKTKILRNNNKYLNYCLKAPTMSNSMKI